MPNLFKWLFDTVQPQPLTQEQRLACIDNSQCQLLVAAAGSGKTSTMVGKVAYSIAIGQLKPEQILVLAFNVSVARELSERISSSLFNVLGKEISVEASTLHALGLQILLSDSNNYRILNDTDNKKLIKKIIHKYCKTDIQFADNYLLFLTCYYENFAIPSDFNNSYQWRKHVKNNGFSLNKLYGFLTIKGELVFTQFEQVIANWLCVHGIKYKYKYTKRTKALKHVLPRFRFGNLKHQAYFQLSDYDIELHCVDNDLKHRNNPKKVFLSAKQFINWTLFNKFRRTLLNMGVNVIPINFNKLQKQYSYVSKLFLNDYQLDFLQSFIRSYRLSFVDNKNNQENIVPSSDSEEYSTSKVNKLNLRRKYSNPIDSNRLNIHSEFLNQLCSFYQEYLQQNNLIDFEGMLLNAAQRVSSGSYLSQYKLILVDEFQDTSGASINLLKALLQQNPDNKIFAVGDDWQSIYSFAGALPDVMLNFDNYFDGYICTTNHLTNTFRFNQHIADTASNFVQANPLQIKKQVVAHSPADLNSIKLHYYSSINSMYMACHQCLIKINSKQAFVNLKSSDQNNDQNNGKFNVYILGRYKHQEPPDLHAWQAEFPMLNITFSTVHAAKGMQADAVIILGLHTGKYGFPSQVKSDVLLEIFNTNKDAFPYAQERRLFYVALTRTKGDVYLLAGKRSPSPFIAEVASSILPENII